MVWLHFTGGATRVRHTDAEREEFELDMVSDLHTTLGQHPDDPTLRRLVPTCARRARASPSCGRRIPSAGTKWRVATLGQHTFSGRDPSRSS